MRRITRSRAGRAAASVVTLLTAGLVVVATGTVVPADASHGDFTETEGVYRIPYADGTDVRVNRDHHTHAPAKDRIDLSAVGGTGTIVASASGWIRAIVDHNGDTGGAGDGKDKDGNPQDDSLEHSCPRNDPDNTVVGDCSDYNNYVWIEHPNGEWTKYSHVGTKTVSANWSEGDWINAGYVLGLEDDIGAARGRHLHYEVAATTHPDIPLRWDPLGGFIRNATNRVPRVCDIANNLYVAGETYTANRCDHQPPTADAGGPYAVDKGSSLQLDGTGSSDPENNPLTFIWSPDTNLDDRRLAQPTYTGVDDAFEVLVLSVYDQIEARRSTAFTFITVNNVAPTVDVGPDVTLTSTQTYQLLARFSDPGVFDAPWTFEIEWGDGEVSDGSTNVQAGLSNPLVANHAYCAAGTYLLSLSVTDKDGGTGSDSKQVTVEHQQDVIDVKPGSDSQSNGHRCP